MADANRVELIIQLTGDRDAYNSLLNLKRAADQLRNHKINIDIDKANLRYQINEVRRSMELLRREMRVEGATAEAQDEYRRLGEVLEDLRRQMRDLNLEAQLDSTGIRAATQDMREMEEAAERSVASLHALADAMILLGNLSGGLASFAEGIGNSFTAMASIFQTNIVDNVERMLTYMATRGVTGSIGSAINRYDILNTFEQYMQLAGVASERSAEALQRVNDAILGLPIGLDEAAQRLRRYQMFLGDIDRATNLTIGLQNALFAGGANEAARTTAYYQIDRLLTVGRLNTARQWNALLVGLGVSTRYVAEEMGYSFKNISDFAAGLSSGAISTDEFLMALERLGTGATASGQKLQSALDIYKGTLDSWMRNISFAFQRGTANIMGALDKALEEVSGRGITGYMERFRNAVNDFYKGGVTLLDNNPQIVAENMGALERLLDSLRRFSGSELAANVLQNLARFMDMLSQALDRLPVGTTEKFIAFATTLAGPLGKLFKTISSGLPIVLGVFQRFKDFDFELLLDKIITQAERLARVVAGLLSIIPDGLMGDLIAFGLVWGKPIAATLTALGNALHYVATSLSAASLGLGVASGGTLLSTIIGFAQAHPAIAAATAALSAFAVGYKLMRDADEEYLRKRSQRITDELAEKGLYDMTAFSETAKSAIGGIADARKKYNEELSNIGQAEEKSRELIEKILEQEDKIAGAKGADRAAAVAKRNVYMTQLGEISDAFSLSLDAESDALDKNSRAQLENATAVIEAWKTAERMKQYESRVGAIVKEQMAAEDAQATLETYRENVRSLREEIEAERNALMASAPQSYLDRYYGRSSLGKGITADRGYSDWTEQMIILDEKLGRVTNRERQLDLASKMLEKTLESLGYETEEITKAMSALGLAAESASQGVEGITAERWREIRQEAQKTFEQQLSGFDAVEKASAISAEKIAKNLGSQTKVAEQYSDSLEKALDYMNTHDLPGLDKVLAEMAAQGIDATGLLLGIADAIDNADDSAVEKIVEAYTKKLAERARAADYLTVAQAMAEGMSNADLESAFSSVGDEGKHLLLKWIGMDNPEAAGAELARRIERAIEYAKTGIDPLASTNFTIEAPTEIKPIMPGRVGDPMAPGGQRFGLFDRNANGLNIPIEVDADDAQSAIDATVEGIVTGAKNVSDALEELAQNGVKEVEGGAGGALGAVEDLEDGVNSVADTMDSRRGSVSDLASEMGDLAREAEAAQAALSLVKAALDLLNGSEANVTVNTVENTVVKPRPGSGNTDHVTQLLRATGGPSGTDTVNAWLSPGEYVMRKGAVDKLGASFLSRLNSLDIKGAIDSMMHNYYRAPAMPSLASYTTNSYDNRNITVNQNVRTNNPHFANRRITSRFAHAL